MKLWYKIDSLPQNRKQIRMVVKGGWDGQDYKEEVVGIIGLSCLILVFKVGQQQSIHANDEMKKTCPNMRVIR